MAGGKNYARRQRSVPPGRNRCSPTGCEISAQKLRCGDSGGRETGNRFNECDQCRLCVHAVQRAQCVSVCKDAPCHASGRKRAPDSSWPGVMLHGRRRRSWVDTSCWACHVVVMMDRRPWLANAERSHRTAGQLVQETIGNSNACRHVSPSLFVAHEETQGGWEGRKRKAMLSFAKNLF
jgi:hypothetical protein